MRPTVLEEMQSYVGFTAEDADRVARLSAVVAPAIPAIVERFYAVIQEQPGARDIFDGPEQVERLKRSLTHWLGSLFCGRYDAAYAQQRSAIGQVHVRVGLPQHYMFCGMEIIWQSLAETVRAAAPPDAEACLASLHKLLTIETGLMLESYSDSYSNRIRQIERETLHERLTRAEHLAQIGQLAASLAHEIKNPLAGISGAIQVIRTGMPSSDTRRPILEEILRQIDRLDRTVKDLLIYARPKPPRRQKCDLAAVIARILTLLREEPELQHVRIEAGGQPVLPPVDADEHQIEQLLLNLVLNAAQASRPGDAIRVRTAADDSMLELAVIDRGHGMAADVLQRATEPFYTTKARGSGLGLPICQKIVEGHGGELKIESELGQGTTVRVRLPLRAATPLSLARESGAA